MNFGEFSSIWSRMELRLKKPEKLIFTSQVRKLANPLKFKFLIKARELCRKTRIGFLYPIFPQNRAEPDLGSPLQKKLWKLIKEKLHLNLSRVPAPHLLLHFLPCKISPPLHFGGYKSLHFFVPF